MLPHVGLHPRRAYAAASAAAQAIPPTLLSASASTTARQSMSRADCHRRPSNDRRAADAVSLATASETPSRAQAQRGVQPSSRLIRSWQLRAGRTTASTGSLPATHCASRVIVPVAGCEAPARAHVAADRGGVAAVAGARASRHPVGSSSSADRISFAELAIGERAISGACRSSR